MTDEYECHEKGKVQVLPEDKINSIINDMDTEFTGNASKWLLPLTILAVRYSAQDKEQVSEIIEECKNTQLAAEDLVKLRWIKKTEDLRSKVKGMTFESRTRREK